VRVYPAQTVIFDVLPRPIRRRGCVTTRLNLVDPELVGAADPGICQRAPTADRSKGPVENPRSVGSFGKLEGRRRQGHSNHWDKPGYEVDARNDFERPGIYVAIVTQVTADNETDWPSDSDDEKTRESGGMHHVGWNVKIIPKQQEHAGKNLDHDDPRNHVSAHLGLRNFGSDVLGANF
jgi:hypothetical protein